MEKLTKAQENVLNYIFESKLSEKEAIKKAKISEQVYEKWFRQQLFFAIFTEKIEKCQRQADIRIAVGKNEAAKKLIALTECSKEVTARQACLDIIKMKSSNQQVVIDKEKTDMKPETQERILKILDDEK